MVLIIIYNGQQGKCYLISTLCRAPHFRPSTTTMTSTRMLGFYHYEKLYVHTRSFTIMRLSTTIRPSTFILGLLPLWGLYHYEAIDRYEALDIHTRLSTIMRSFITMRHSTFILGCLPYEALYYYDTNTIFNHKKIIELNGNRSTVIMDITNRCIGGGPSLRT